MGVWRYVGVEVSTWTWTLPSSSSQGSSSPSNISLRVTKPPGLGTGLATVGQGLYELRSMYEQVSVSSGIGRTEGPKYEMPLKW